MLHSTPGSVGKRIALVLLVAAIATALYYLASALRTPTPVAAISQQPFGYAGRLVYVTIAEAREGSPVLGCPSWQVTDDGKSYVTLISRQPVSAGTVACVLVHTPSPFGQCTAVLEQRPDSLAQAVEELLSRLGPEKPSACPAPPVATTQQISGTVAEETRQLGLTALNVQCADGQLRTVLLKGEGLPAGAQVTATVRRVAGTEAQGLPELYEADEVITSVGSIVTNPQSFADRSVVVQGEVTSGISVMGNGAFELAGDKGETLVVLGGGQAPEDGAEVKVRGKVRYLVGMGKVAWQMLCAESVEPIASQPGATPPAVSK